jgi:hypothetical protein
MVLAVVFQLYAKGFVERYSSFFVEKHKLKREGANLYAKLFYDSEQKAIAIQFTETKATGLYKMNMSPKYGATCKIKSFLLNNEINTELHASKYTYKKYPAAEIGLEGSEIYVIKLKNKAESVANKETTM